MNNKKVEYPIFIVTACILAARFLGIIIGGTSSTITIVLSSIPLVALVLVKKEILVTKTLAIIVAWDLFNLAYILFTYNSYYLRVIMFQNIALLFTSISENYYLNEKNKTNVIRWCALVCILLWIMEIITGGRLRVAMALVSLSFFVLAYFPKKLLATVAMSAGFYLIGARSSILMILLEYILYYWFIKRKPSLKAYQAMFAIIALFVLFIPTIYVGIYHSSYATRINALSLRYFHENFFSGRNRLWPIIIQWLDNGNKLIGLGGKFVGGDYAYDLGVSTHNLLLFLRGQGGYFLVILFILFLYKIYRRIYDHLDDQYIAAGSAYLLSLLFRTGFDLIMLANYFVDSIMMWFVLCTVITYNNALERDM